MAQMHERIAEAREEKRRFSPAGQSTQVIVGADATTDADVLRTSATLYGAYKLKRVYYSAFSPIPESSAILPLKPPPMQRENRLYQADWLLRYYGFGVEEIAAGGCGRHARSRHRPEARLGAEEPASFPGRREQGRPRDAAARAGPRRAGGRPHHRRRGGTRPCASTMWRA